MSQCKFAGFIYIKSAIDVYTTTLCVCCHFYYACPALSRK